MSRLYGLHASHPTSPTCELIDAQNSLLEQSIRDARGISNVDGWGIGHVLADGSLNCERQVDPAHDSERYRRTANSVESISVVAHIRRATVGEPRMLEAMANHWIAEIRGDTDSEHVFLLLMSRLQERGTHAMVDTLKETVTDIRAWCREEGADHGRGLARSGGRLRLVDR